MRTGIIYKISNTVNDKVYIGQTIQQLKRRWDQHCRYSKFSDTHVSRAIRRGYKFHGHRYIYLNEKD